MSKLYVTIFKTGLLWPIYGENITYKSPVNVYFICIKSPFIMAENLSVAVLTALAVLSVIFGLTVFALFAVLSLLTVLAVLAKLSISSVLSVLPASAVLALLAL